MRIAQDEAVQKRQASEKRQIDKINEKLDKQMTEGLKDVPRDEEGRLAPGAEFVYRKGTYVLLKPAVKPSSKFAPRLGGPYLVLNHFAKTNTVEFRDLVTGAVQKVPAVRLIPFDDSRLFTKELKQLTELDSTEYVVEEILGHPYTRNGRLAERDRYEFEVKWLGFAKPTMETYNSIVFTKPFRTYCTSRPKLLRTFEKEWKAKSKSKRRMRSKWTLTGEDL
ncbi:hypothetical protein ADUPG1_001349, partial [Aduncisulcus paluster]